MPRDERKRQKALMKHRSSFMLAAMLKAHQQDLIPSSPNAILRPARNYPLIGGDPLNDDDEDDIGIF